LAPVNNYYYPCIPILLSKQKSEKKAGAARTGHPKSPACRFFKIVEISKKIREANKRIVTTARPPADLLVDKQLDIHSSVCAKPTSLCTS
jgi:hypothetical protein